MGMVQKSPVDYWLTEDGLVLLEAWARDGCDIQEMANKIGVSRQKFCDWRKKYPEIARAVSVGRELVDYKVENALLKSALGYTTKEIKVTLGKKIFNGETVEMLKETTTREIAPSVPAIMFWLNNRKHDQWKRNRDRNMEIDEEDNNISITIVRGPKNEDLGDNVNQEVTMSAKVISEEEKEKRKAKKEAEELEKYPDEVEEEILDENDPDYWPDDWEDEDEE